MTITREYCERIIRRYTALLNIIQSDIDGDNTVDIARTEHFIELHRLALEGLDARWRDCSVDPPPEIEGTTIMSWEFGILTTAFIAMRVDGTWRNLTTHEATKLGTHWSYVTPPKTGEVK